MKQRNKVKKSFIFHPSSFHFLLSFFSFLLFTFCFNPLAITQSQSFQLDSTFQPFFDIRGQLNVTIYDIYENPPDGRIYLVGNFENYQGTKAYQGSVCYEANGGLFSSYNFISGQKVRSTIFRLNDTTFYFGNGADNGSLRDTLGNGSQIEWRKNFLNTVNCRESIPYFYPDGSSLFGNGIDGSGEPCDIEQPDSTYDGRHIIKVNPEGFWDSTFVGDANHEPFMFIPYDKNRIMIGGSTGRMTHYNGIRVNGFCRIFLDGRLDTTLQSPFKDTNTFSIALIRSVEENGKIFVSGAVLEGQDQFSHLLRLNSDGSVDSTFMNYDNTVNPSQFSGSVNAVANTPDGGYLIGGSFSKYQGYELPSLAKLDSSGKVEPKYFQNGIGPDSAYQFGAVTQAGVNKILPSKFGGYYIAGNFLKWGDQPSQPIVRITELDSADWFDTTSSIHESTFNFTKDDIRLYPNPTTNSLSISSSEAIQYIQLYTIIGKAEEQKITVHSIKKYELDLSTQSSGIYFVRIELKSGEVLSRKVIKQ